MNFKKNIYIFILMVLEILLIYSQRDIIIDFCKYFSQETVNNYDNLLVGLIGSVLFSFLQVVNLGFINITLIYSRKYMLSLFRNFFGYKIDKLNYYINKMIGYIFSNSIKNKWGPNQNSEKSKNANIAEGLIAAADAIEAGIILSDSDKKQINEIIASLISKIDENGYKSYSEGIYTVHCTGMVLYAIKRFVDLDEYEIGDDDYERIRACLKKMLSNANEYGWGFANERCDAKYNRALSTIWALRALNSWDFCQNKDFYKILDNLIGHSKGVIGFASGNEPKYSSTAMLYILIQEIENIRIKQKVLDKIDTGEVHKFLIKGLKSETEVEEFMKSKTEEIKRPWTHLTECLVLQALAPSYNKLNILNVFKISIMMRCILSKIDSNRFIYVAKTMNFDHSDPFIYPTMYLISALCLLSKGISDTN